MKHSRKVRQAWKAVCASTLVGYGIVGVTSTPAVAQDAFWAGPGNEYTNPNNWNPNVVPQNQATFANQGPAGVTISNTATIGEVRFADQAQAYTIINSSDYSIVGKGVTNDSNFTQVFTNNGNLNITNNAQVKAGQGVVFNNVGQPLFGNGGIVGGTNATLNFADNSRADGVDFNNIGGGVDDGGTGGLVVGGNATLNFRDNSQADKSDLRNVAGDANSADFGGITTGGNATLAFSGKSHADKSEFYNVAGDANNSGFGASPQSVTIINGGDANLTFSNYSHADNSEFSNLAGQAQNGGFGLTGLGGTIVGGDAIFTFNDNSHADNSNFYNVAGNATGYNLPGLTVGGNTLFSFNNNSHADNSIMENMGGDSTGGFGSLTGGSASVIFNDNSHADNSQFFNGGGNVTNSGSGGAANLTFNDSAHADKSFFFNIGGIGTDAGVGENATILFNVGTSADQSTFINNGGDGVDNNNLAGVGGNAAIIFSNTSAGKSLFSNVGGNSTGVGAGGLGIGGRAVVTFSGNADAGTATDDEDKTQIFNSGSGDFSGPGMTSTGGTGETVFNDNSSAGTAVITNNSGGAVFFNDTATADDATIINNAGGLVDTRGIVAVGIGSLSGAGDVVIGGGTVTLGNLNRDEEISGVIQDGLGAPAGSIVKTGTGTLILSNVNTYTGTTTVDNGNLQVDGSLVSGINVNSGGILSGTGSGFSISNSGFVAPGNESDPFGTLSVFSFVNNNDGRYLARVDDNGNSNQLQTFVSTLDGQVFVQGRGLFLNQNLYTYNIVSAFGLNGAFDPNIDPNSQIPYYLDGTVANVGGIVELTLTRNEDLPNFTSNQQGVFNSVQDADINDPQFDPIFAFLAGANNANQFQRALNSLSGDALTSYQLAAQGVSERFNERMRTQSLLQGAGTNDDDQFALRASPRIAYDGTRYRALFAAANGMQGGSTPGMAERKASRTGVWATIARARENTDSDGNGADFDARATEFQVGVNRTVNNRTNFGVSVGRSDGRVDINDRDANGDLDTTSIGAYLRHESESFYASGQLSYSRHSIDSTRNTLGGQATADFNARTIGLSGEIGKRMKRGKYSLEPNISLKLSNTKQDGFQEDGPGGLDVDSENYNTRRLGLGVRFINRDAAARVRPHLFLGYEREFGDRKAELTNQLTGLSSFDVSSSDLGRNIFSIRAGVDARINDRFSVIGELGASYRSNQNSQFIYGGVKYGF